MRNLSTTPSHSPAARARAGAARIIAKARGITSEHAANGYTRLIDAKSASRILGVPPTWLLAQARAGRIPHHRLGHYVRFNPDDLTEWLEQNRIEPGPPGGRGPRV